MNEKKTHSNVQNKITIPYQIKGIRPSDKKEGYVEVLMEPVDKLEYDNQDKPDNIPIKVIGTGPNGTPFPPEFQQQLTQMLKNAVPPFFHGKKNYDPRKLIHVESEIDFLTRNWKYGDIINVTLEKIKKAEDVEQTKE
jgi:hypothetical protein